jgi:hypothetical protein
MCLSPHTCQHSAILLANLRTHGTELTRNDTFARYLKQGVARLGAGDLAEHCANGGVRMARRIHVGVITLLQRDRYRHTMVGVDATFTDDFDKRERTVAAKCHLVGRQSMLAPFLGEYKAVPAEKQRIDDHCRAMRRRRIKRNSAQAPASANAAKKGKASEGKKGGKKGGKKSGKKGGKK